MHYPCAHLFAQIKNSIIDSPRSDYGVELFDVLGSIEKQSIFNPDKLEGFFWDMFIVDAYIGNFDRHNGNRGFLINNKNRTAEIALVFDCGSSLHPQATDEQLKLYLSDKK